MKQQTSFGSLFIALAVSSFIVAEALCRFYGTVNTVTHIHFGIYRLADSSRRLFELAPGVVKGKLAIFENGFRDPYISLAKGENVYRIAVVGNSFTFGKGLSIEKTYAKVLEKQLRETGSTKVIEVLNFAVPGYRPLELAYEVKEKITNYHPDLILFMLKEENKALRTKIITKLFSRTDSDSFAYLLRKTSDNPLLSLYKFSHFLQLLYNRNITRKNVLALKTEGKPLVLSDTLNRKRDLRSILRSSLSEAGSTPVIFLAVEDSAEVSRYGAMPNETIFLPKDRIFSSTSGNHRNVAQLIARAPQFLAVIPK